MGIFNWFRKIPVGEKRFELHRAESNFRQVQKDQQSTVFQSGKSHLASDECAETHKYTQSTVTYEPLADSIEFKGKEGISYVVGLIEERDKYKKLLESQHRMVNRLYKLAATSVEDPGKSITEDLRKAEKWKATLNRKFKALKED